MVDKMIGSMVLLSNTRISFQVALCMYCNVYCSYGIGSLLNRMLALFGVCFCVNSTMGANSWQGHTHTLISVLHTYTVDFTSRFSSVLFTNPDKLPYPQRRSIRTIN